EAVVQRGGTVRAVHETRARAQLLAGGEAAQVIPAQPEGGAERRGDAPQVADINAGDQVVRVIVVDDRERYITLLGSRSVGGKHQRGVVGAHPILPQIEAAPERVSAERRAQVALERPVV